MSNDARNIIITVQAFTIILLLLFIMNDRFYDEPDIYKPNITVRVPVEPKVIPVKTSYVQAGKNGPMSQESLDMILSVKEIDDYGVLVGNSMQPTIFEGNTVLSKKISDEELKVGMLVRYTSLDKPDCIAKDNPHIVQIDYVIHRIAAIYNNNTILVQGDNNQFSEEIKKCQITHIIIGNLYT